MMRARSLATRAGIFYARCLGGLLLASCAASARQPGAASESKSAPSSMKTAESDPTSSPNNTEKKETNGVNDASGTAAPPPSVNTGATPTLVDDIPHAMLAFDQSAALFTASGTDCGQLCKALASMQRAADHLCDLTKDGADLDKQKCNDARVRVTTAKDRVTKACGGCGP